MGRLYREAHALGSNDNCVLTCHRRSESGAHDDDQFLEIVARVARVIGYGYLLNRRNRELRGKELTGRNTWLAKPTIGFFGIG